MLRRYREKHERLPCSISTFGFGYELDSELLQELAEEGDGSYAFIPDSGFVGTVFVNALSNLLSTAATGLRLSLEADEEGCEILVENDGGGGGIYVPAGRARRVCTQSGASA